MAEDLDIHSFVAGAAASLARTAGAIVQTARGAQQAAFADMGDGEVKKESSGTTGTYVELGARGPARRGAPNDFGWRAQHRAEMMGYRETVLNLGDIAINGVITLDPNICTNFVAVALGNCSVTITAPEAPVDVDPYAPTPSYIYAVKLWLKRPIGTVVTWSGVRWPVDVTDPDGDAGTSDSLLGAATKGEFDSYVLVVVPGFGTFGYLAGRGF
jgi:hypothetical protein